MNVREHPEGSETTHGLEYSVARWLFVWRKLFGRMWPSHHNEQNVFLFNAHILDSHTYKSRQNMTEFKYIRICYDKKKSTSKRTPIVVHSLKICHATGFMDISVSVPCYTRNISALLSCGCFLVVNFKCLALSYCTSTKCVCWHCTITNLLYGYISMLHSSPDISIMVIVSRVQAWLVKYWHLCKIQCSVIMMW